MQSIEDKILSYPDLSDSERAEVDLYVQEHPDARTLLDEVLALYALFEKADVWDDESLSEYVLLAGTNNLPPALSAQFEDIERRLEVAPELRQRVESLRASLSVLTEGSDDPEQRFQELLGSVTSRTQSTSAAEVTARRKGMRLVRVSQLALAACLGIAAIYCVLVVVSLNGQSEREQVVALNETVDSYQPLALRGGDSSTLPPELDEAVELIGHARSTTFGLFPRYDEAQLEEAADLAQSIAIDTSVTMLLRLRASFVHGQILAHQGEDEAAIQSLQMVIDNQGEYASEAARIIDFLQSG